MPSGAGLLNTFFGAGFTSALVYYLATDIEPLIAAIIWTLPFTMIFPVYNMHKNKKSNAFISNYLKTQTFTMILLLVFLYATAYFVEKGAKDARYYNSSTKRRRHLVNCRSPILFTS